MCALQECSNIPLLSVKSNEIKCSDVMVRECSNDSLNLNSSNFSDVLYQTRHGPGEYYPDEVLDFAAAHNNITSVPPCLEGQPYGSNHCFQVPRNSENGYSEINPVQSELQHLLCTKFSGRDHFVQDAECVVPQHTKRPLSQRSISDYYLSRKQDEPPKMTITANISSETTPHFKESIHLCSSTQCCSTMNHEHVESQTCNNEISSQPNIEAFKCYRSHNSNTICVDCEPSVSDISNTLEDIEDRSSYEAKKIFKTGNLNPTVNLKIFDTESLESGEFASSGGPTAELSNQRVMDDTWFITSAQHSFGVSEQLSGSTSAAQLSIASSFGDSSTPTCKICHMPAKSDDPLISPCRCTGTLHYIHCGCLMRWLEICNKRSRKPPACELCKYQFHWHKKFKVRHWQFPHCSWRDKILHTVFLISVLVMISCAIVTVLCFRQHRGNKTDLTHLELTQSEIITLICGALFFLAFFLAMYVEIKARNTIYKLLIKFIYLNQQWYIDEYDKKGENTVIDV